MADKWNLSESLRSGHGILISCLPERLAYYQGELAIERYILERRDESARGATRVAIDIVSATSDF